MLDFSPLRQYHILEPNLPKIIWMTETFEKTNIKVVLLLSI